MPCHSLGYLSFHIFRMSRTDNDRFQSNKRRFLIFKLSPYWLAHNKTYLIVVRPCCIFNDSWLHIMNYNAHYYNLRMIMMVCSNSLCVCVRACNVQTFLLCNQMQWQWEHAHVTHFRDKHFKWFTTITMSADNCLSSHCSWCVCNRTQIVYMCVVRACLIFIVIIRVQLMGICIGHALLFERNF